MDIKVHTYERISKTSNLSAIFFLYTSGYLECWILYYLNITKNHTYIRTYAYSHPNLLTHISNYVYLAKY